MYRRNANLVYAVTFFELEASRLVLSQGLFHAVQAEHHFHDILLYCRPIFRALQLSLISVLMRETGLSFSQEHELQFAAIAIYLKLPTWRLLVVGNWYFDV
jgi:hypothetical protein